MLRRYRLLFLGLIITVSFWTVVYVFHFFFFGAMSLGRFLFGKGCLLCLFIRIPLYFISAVCFTFLMRMLEKKKFESRQRNITFRISEQAYTSYDLNELYKNIHDMISGIIPSRENFYIAIYNKEKDLIEFPYFIDQKDGSPGSRKAGRGLTEYVLKTKQPLLVKKKEIDKLCAQNLIEKIGSEPVEWLGIPLKMRGEAFGVLAIQSYRRGLRFRREEVKILTFVSEQIAMAIDRRRTQAAVKRNEELFRSVIESAHHGICIIDGRYRITYANRQLAGILGYYLQEIIGTDFRKFIAPADIALVTDFFAQRIKGEESPDQYELTLLAKNGETPIAEIRISDRQDSQGRYQATVHIMDITERKQSEERIAASLKEKEILLREVHHRVKNNMQIISSLLNLQSRGIQNREMLELFRESQNRVRSMALIHERLYRADDLARVDLASYISGLSGYLFQVYGIKKNEINMDVHVRDVFLSINAAIPVGLIVNELISNALKHAFPDGKKGTITVSVTPDEDSGWRLIVQDNGIGLPENIDIKRTETLGLQLVFLLTIQMNGEIRISRDNGSSFDILIKEEPHFMIEEATSL